MRLYLIRHGETEYNKTGIVQGYTDVPLNETGMDQIDRLARRIAAETTLDRIYASDLHRTVMSADILAAETGAPVTYNALFRERDPGDLTNKTYDEAEGFFTDLDYAPPNGETVPVFMDRVRRAMAWLLDREGATGHYVALVTHGMFCRAFYHVCLGRDPMEIPAWRNACLTVADYAPDAGWTPITLACVAHLDTPDPTAHATGA